MSKHRDIELEQLQLQRQYSENRTEEERIENTRLIAIAHEEKPAGMTDKEKLALVWEFAYNCGDCGKGGCSESDCMGWVFQQILDSKPFGKCDWCGEPTPIPLADVMREREPGEDRMCAKCQAMSDEDEALKIPMYES